VAYYPLFLELSGRPCLVIGGGEVAQRKVEGLLAAGAQVTVISPQLTPALQALRDEGRLRHLAREYAPGDLTGYALAFVATDDGAVNARAVREGRELGVWVNVVDDPGSCDFIVPSVLRRGELVIAISTGGRSPALARKVREELEAFLDEGYGQLLELVAQVREELKGRGMAPDAALWNAALAPELRQLLAQGRGEEARRRLLAALGAGSEVQALES